MSIASLGVDFGVLNVLNLWVACLAPASTNHSQLVDFVFYEDRPDLGEIETTSRKVFTEVPASVTEVLLPWTNFHRSESLTYWRGWTEGTNLCAVSAAGTPVIRVPLETVPSRFVRPALSVASGEFDVPFISDGGRALSLVRFIPDSDKRPGSGSVLWRVPLADKPVGAGAALGPESGNSQRRIALVRQDKTDVVVEVLDLSNGRPMPGTFNARIPESFSVPGSDPGVRIDDKGATHVSLLVASSADLTNLAVVDITFVHGRESPPVLKIEKARKLTTPPLAAGVAFQSCPDRPMRRDWVVLLPNGMIFHNQSAERPMKPRGKPVTPLQLVAMSQATYVLTVGLEGPILEALQ